MNIEIPDGQVDALAGWIHDCFDDYRRGYRDCLSYWEDNGGTSSPEAVEELGEYRATMPALKLVYWELTGKDLLEMHGIQL